MVLFIYLLLYLMHYLIYDVIINFSTIIYFPFCLCKTKKIHVSREYPSLQQQI